MPDFGTRERRRQARFRNESPTVSAAGRSPTDDKGRRHGHLLALGCEEENLYPPLRGERGASRFLRDRRIKWWSSSRSGDRSGGVRPTRNLASSQLACINFLLPLANEPTALAAALSAIDDDIVGIASIEDPDAGTKSLVEIEWIGLNHALEGPGQKTRGANTTSIDALVVAETASGRRAYLIEWKYVEEYRRQYLGDGSKGATRLERYSEAYAASPFLPVSTPVTAWFYEPFYQIMRQRLLSRPDGHEGGTRCAGCQGRGRCAGVQSRIQGADHVAGVSGKIHERSNGRRGRASRNHATRHGICLRLRQHAGGGPEAAVRKRGRRMERIPQGSIRLVIPTGEELR